MNIYEAIWKKSNLATALFITLTDRIALDLKNVNVEFLFKMSWYKQLNATPGNRTLEAFFLYQSD